MYGILLLQGGNRMKELKFRAKANINNEWIYARNIHKVISDDTNEELWVMHPKDEKIEHLGDGYIKYRPLVVNEETIGQYTGLKDINGVEIYEGDVLFHQLQGRRKVYYPYSETVASYGLRDIDNGMGSTLQDSHAVWEVIGNIHENGDLLK